MYERAHKILTTLLLLQPTSQQQHVLKVRSMSSGNNLTLPDTEIMAWNAWNGVSHLQSALCRNNRFFFQLAHSGQLVDCEEIFTEFDMTCIWLEMHTLSLMRWAACCSKEWYNLLQWSINLNKLKNLFWIQNNRSWEFSFSFQFFQSNQARQSWLDLIVDLTWVWIFSALQSWYLELLSHEMLKDWGLLRWLLLGFL